MLRFLTAILKVDVSRTLLSELFGLLFCLLLGQSLVYHALLQAFELSLQSSNFVQILEFFVIKEWLDARDEV